MLREQVRRAKEDGKTVFCNSDSFLDELSGCYDDGFQECLRQVKALYPNLDVSQVSLGNVAQTPARTVELLGTDELFKVDPTPNAHGDEEATPEDEQVKSVEDENRPVGEDEPIGLEKVMNEEASIDQPQLLKFTIMSCFLFFVFTSVV